MELLSFTLRFNLLKILKYYNIMTKNFDFSIDKYGWNKQDLLE